MDNLHADHRKRMMERFCKYGIAGMNDFEVLEVLLYFSIPRSNTNETAHQLLRSFGSLHGVLEAPMHDLTKVEGVGTRSAQLIHFAHELFGRYQADAARERQEGVRMNSAEKMGAYFIPQFAGAPVERFLAAYCDSSGRVLRCEVISEGSPLRVSVDMRKIISNAFACNAAGVVLAHNHPGGTITPSEEDFALTDRADSVMAAVGLRLIDHIVVAGERFCSVCSLRFSRFGARGY